MKFTIRRTSGNWHNKNSVPVEGIIIENERWLIEINSLEELLKLAQQVDERIILHLPDNDECFWDLEIYDDYRE